MHKKPHQPKLMRSIYRISTLSLMMTRPLSLDIIMFPQSLSLLQLIGCFSSMPKCIEKTHQPRSLEASGVIVLELRVMRRPMRGHAVEPKLKLCRNTLPVRICRLAKSNHPNAQKKPTSFTRASGAPHKKQPGPAGL